MQKHAVNNPVAQYSKGPCHTDGTLIFTKDGTEFYAGRYAGVGKRGYSFIMDLAKSVTATVSGTNTRGTIKTFVDGLGAQIMHLNWPDFGIISWERERFEALLAAIKADHLESVYVCCIGGHGRTGTMLSILAGLSGAVPDGRCPVEWLREIYCDNVVESEEQLAYIEKITGIKVTATPGKVWTNTAYKGGTYVSGGGNQGSLYQNSYQHGAPWQQKVYASSKAKDVTYDGKYTKPN